MTKLTPYTDEQLRAAALKTTMATRLVGDVRARDAFEVADAYLRLTEPDPRMKFMEPSIMTVTGRYFRFDRPEDFDWNLEDIAHGLAHQCRFGGHCNSFYSIAQHLVMAAALAEDRGEAGLMFESLMHDAHEAFYLDIMTPFKILLPDYRRWEHHGESVMRDKFSLLPHMPQEVKTIDLIMLGWEKRDLMSESGFNWAVLDPVRDQIPEDTLEVWAPEEAKQAFIEFFSTLAPDEVFERTPRR